MRLGVLDIGSNTGHLLVVDAHDGSAPLPASSHKQRLRLAEHLDHRGAVTDEGVAALTAFTAEAVAVAEDKGCEEMLPFATSAVRDAVNSEDVLAHVARETGVQIPVLSGEDEARLTFLAVSISVCAATLMLAHSGAGAASGKIVAWCPVDRTACLAGN